MLFEARRRRRTTATRRNGVALIGTCALTALSILSAADIARAQTTLFDLESEPNTWNPPPARPGALATKVLSGGGINVTVRRNLSANFDIVNNVDDVPNAVFQAGKPASWGLRSLDPFFNLTPDAFWIIEFSTPISGFSLEYGDYGDDGDTAILTAFTGLNGTGTNVATASNSLPSTGNTAFTSNLLAVSVGGNSISSVTFQSTSTNNFINSVFLDNLNVTVTPAASAAPEPGSLSLVAMVGLTVIGAVVRRRRTA